ncbi:MAG TPA: STAS domain-containing protein [Casimicrobiaceae bacterium]|nr:STAS domain-containing protein [Casimicrobiaceae bacterium]
MALFSKPPVKKTPLPGGAKPATDRLGPATGSAAIAPRPSARDLAAKAGAQSKDRRPRLEPVPSYDSITGTSLIDLSGAQQIEVAQANPGLCAVLENAALLYANGQAVGARSLLEQGVATDHDAKQSSLAWLALFDLLQRAGDRAAFDQLAIQYSVQFERSTPGWEGREAASGPKASAGGYVALTSKLTADSAAQIEGLRRAIQKRVAGARLDLSSIAGFDDAGARLLAAALAEARKAGLRLTIERQQKLVAALEAALKTGRDAGEGAWMLSLELLQWMHEQVKFDERAIEYAVSFEMSPPSWEPPALALAPEDVPAGSAPAAPNVESLKLSGVIAGSASAHTAKLADYAHGRQAVGIDFSEVERIDFVCSAALLNAINRIEGARKSVHVSGATPIIRAMLLLIGLSPRHFVKKAG